MPSRPSKPGPSPRLDAEVAASLRKELIRWLARYTSDAALADDLAQETFVHLLHGLPRYRGAAALTTWARRIAVNAGRPVPKATSMCRSPR